MKLNKVNPLNNNQGTVVLFALLIIAGTIATALAMGFLITRELQQAKNVDNSIVAYYAAESGIEDALFKLRKKENVGINDLKTPQLEPLDNNSTWDRVAVWPDAIYGFIEENKFLAVDIYELNNNSCLTGIESLVIKCSDTHPNAWLEISLLKWQWSSGSLNWEVVTEPHIVNQFIISSDLCSEPGGYPINNIAQDSCYRVKLKALYDDISNVQISAYSADNGNGLPKKLLGHIQVTSTGHFGSSRQAIEMKMLRQPPLSGIFDYIVFSEMDLKKGVE